MPSFLVNSKMSPALAARVTASVRGRRSKPGDASAAAHARALIRFVLVVVIVGAGVWLAVSVRQESARVERERTSLLDTVHGHNALLTADEKGAVARDDAWVTAFASTFEGEVVSNELRAPGGLAAVLARPSVYVHGTIDSFHSAVSLEQAAVDSVKDSFLLCLIDPPAARNEKALLGKVHVAYDGGPVLEQRTPDTLRLADAQAVFRILSPAWEARVRGADASGLSKLRGELDRAPMEKGKLALKAGLLIVAMDEPAPVTSPAELDGERAHEVRLAIVDVASSKVFLRTRKHVDPSDWSVKARSDYARGLDECALALDVREGVVAR